MSQEKQLELEYFKLCKTIIKENVNTYEKQIRELHNETELLFHQVQNGNVELYNQLIVTTGLEEHANIQYLKNIAAQKQPYFGRIDYTDIAVSNDEKIYIGKNGVFRNQTDVLIADWRAPIATVYYDNEIGNGSYLLPDGKELEINLKLKRTFDIQNGKWIGYYDSDIVANDELLVKYLSKNKDLVLSDIIATIQKEQNEIIRATPFGNIIVQGVAGSGKTTVAMHRISYILYNYADKFEPNEFCIVGGNDILIQYITAGLPELDVHHVKQKRMDELLCYLLGKDWPKKFKYVETTLLSEEKCHLSFARELTGYLQSMRDEVLPLESIKDRELGIVLSKQNSSNTIREQNESSLVQLLTLLDERLKSRIRFLVIDEDKELYRKKIAEFKGYFSSKKCNKTIVQIYKEFLSAYGKRHQIDVTNLILQIDDHKFDLYDIAALNIIKNRITRKKNDEEFGQIFIDEAQDFGGMVYYALRKTLPKCYFTIMGDVSQNIFYHTGLNDWEELCLYIFNDSKDSFRLLSKSYRNTIEISEFAGKILEKASFGKYKIDPVIRHGMPVTFTEALDITQGITQMSRLLEQMKKRGYETTAIICNNIEEALLIEDKLSEFTQVADGNQNGFQKGVMVLPVFMTKGLEFDTVVLWNPQLLEYEKDPARAKLLYVAATRALHELHIIQI